jgi:hypothetical protein
LPLLDQLQQTAGGKDLQVIAISLDRGGSGPFSNRLAILLRRGLCKAHSDISLR